MIQSMCIMGNEYVCVPCQLGKPLFCGEETIMISYDIHNKIYDKYQKDIHKMAFEFGGAICCDCNKSGGNNCKTCNIDYNYKFKKER